MSTHTSAKETPLQDALSKFREILRSPHKKKILVIGDIMLDVFISGTTDRMSPEADVPILKEVSRDFYLGGASNTAHNIASLGVPVTLIGVIGDDAYGKKVKLLAQEVGITDRTITEENHITTTKTRAVGPQGHLLRIDTESTLPITKETEDALIAEIEKHTADVVLISDYTKGVLTEKVISCIKKRFKGENIFVDTKPSRIHLYTEVGLIKANKTETEAMTRIALVSQETVEEASRALHLLTKSSVVITRGSEGLSVFDTKSNEILHLNSIPTTLKDVTGAGDTTLAILALMHAYNQDLLCSACVANYIASKVVAQKGTTALNKDSLLLQ